ncbi:MAG: NADH-quinone oxidoreductase subunit N, partial [Planctomycetes bacterium]|nr:NADH-quinone oxidoreductase subunit N [Planctomycetota bacterium]
LVYDSLTASMRVFLLTFAVLFVVLARLTGIADSEDGQDFYTLALGATLGLCIMASANHLLMIFLGIEMASVPSYVLAGIVKGRRRSSEAALKYAVYGAGTAGVMLYGISLLAGVLGTAHLPTMAAKLAAMDLPRMLASGEESLIVMVLALGGLMLGVGLAFKLSAVPFHFWCPDVFEGASAEVDAFLSVASKAAAMALLVRVGFGLGQLHEVPLDMLATDHVPAVVATGTTAIETVSFDTIQNETTVDSSPLSPVRRYFVILTAIVAVVTCTFGNLAAYGQTNIKRMFAYSTIAHAGFMMMAVAAAVALLGRSQSESQQALSALMLYIVFYLFMNLGAFAIVAFLRNSMHSEEIADYAGLIRSCPMITVMMIGILVSLIGLPPLAGFWPKLRVLQALYTAGGPLMIFVFVVAAVNTAISLVYYLRVAKTMCMDPEPDTRGPVSIGFLPGAYILVVSLPVFVLGILPDRFAQWADAAVSQLFS